MEYVVRRIKFARTVIAQHHPHHRPPNHALTGGQNAAVNAVQQIKSARMAIAASGVIG